MTISEIASKAGVSAATVSRVLNGKGPVKESTRRLILEIIQQNEYVPSEIARGLSKNNSNNIGVFIPDIENAFFSTAVRGIVERADQFGYNVFLFHTDENVEKEHRYLQTVMGLRIKGLIISPVIESDEQTREWLDRLQSRQVPVVLLDREICGLSLDGVFSQDVACRPLGPERRLAQERGVHGDEVRERLNHLRVEHRGLGAACEVRILGQPSEQVSAHKGLLLSLHGS